MARGNDSIKWRYATALLLLFEITCSPEVDQATRQSVQGQDLAAKCESALARSEAQSVMALPWSYESDLYIGRGERQQAGAIVGAEWDEDEKLLYVFDGISGTVEIFDDAGVHRGNFGGIGKGPGELEEPGTSFRFDQLELTDTNIVLNELRYIHIFDRSRKFVDRFQTDETLQGPHAILHIASISDSSFLFARNRAFRLDNPDWDFRTRIGIVEFKIREVGYDTVNFGFLRNQYSELPPFERFPPRTPYQRLIHRTWDSIPSGLLVITSWEHHGVCFFDVNGGIKKTFRVDAPIVQVDEDEKRRVLDDARAQFGQVAPFTNENWDDFYDNWPETMPRYIDLALSPDSMVWVERPVRDGKRLWDLIHYARGYLGTIEPLGEGAPVAFSSHCAFVVTLAVPESAAQGEAFYGLIRWCREDEESS